jgi:peptidoglycan-associated lipoprotein
MFRRMPFLSFVLMITLLLTAAACNKNKIEDQPEPPAPVKVEEVEAPVEVEVEPEPVKAVFTPVAPKPPSAMELNSKGVVSTVYFAYDSSALGDETRAQLKANASWLKSNKEWHSIVMGGHCDERGTKEYNLALGERRASAARDYLATLGVDRAKLRVISYGEEDPAMAGHDDEAWKMNRRCTFTFK